jgi:hypothetical protein
MTDPFELDLTDGTSKYAYINLDLTNATVSGTNWTSSNYNGTYIGEYQPRAVIAETNPDSPFYDSIDYYCTAGYNPNETALIGSETVSVLNIYVDDVFVDIDDSLKTKVFQYSLSATSGAKTVVSDLLVTSGSSSYGAGYCLCKYLFKDGGRYIQKATGVIKSELLLIGTHIARYNDGGICDGRLMPYYTTTLGTLRIVLSGDKYDNIWSDDLAMQRAQFELYQRCRLLDTVNINILPLYWLDTNWLIEITLPNKNGIEETNQYLIKSISTDGGLNGTQSLSLMRYYPYYPSIN